MEEMKCFACNYEYCVDWCRDEKDRVIKGDKEFIRIDGTFLLAGTGYFETKYEVYLFACPKCGTIKLHPNNL